MAYATLLDLAEERFIDLVNLVNAFSIILSFANSVNFILVQKDDILELHCVIAQFFFTLPVFILATIQCSILIIRLTLLFSRSISDDVYRRGGDILIYSFASLILGWEWKWCMHTSQNIVDLILLILVVIYSSLFNHKLILYIIATAAGFCCLTALAILFKLHHTDFVSLLIRRFDFISAFLWKRHGGTLLY